MNFQKRDISTQSYAFPIQNSRSTQNTRSDNVQLSEIMANYGMKLNDENINNTPKKHQKEYFIPVDYETYSKWMQKSQEEEPQPFLVNSYPKQELKKRPKEVTKKAAQEALEELDPGDDTSQDAADLSSQETKGNEIIDFPMKSSPKNVLQ